MEEAASGGPFHFAGAFTPGLVLPADAGNDALTGPIPEVLLGAAAPSPAYPVTRRTVLNDLFINIASQNSVSIPFDVEPLSFRLLRNGIPLPETTVSFSNDPLGEGPAILPGANLRGVRFNDIVFEPFDRVTLQILGTLPEALLGGAWFSGMAAGRYILSVFPGAVGMTGPTGPLGPTGPGG